jgi:antagonist of KipI
MDPWSHRLANLLVGNRAGAATLEITIVGPELEFDDDRVIAVTGGELDATIDGRPLPYAAAVPIARRSIVRFGRVLRGARAYLAISGGIDTPQILGSRATHLLTRMGGFDGRALKSGDCVPLAAPESVLTPRRSPAAVARPDPAAVVRVVAGIERGFFAPGALGELEASTFVISNRSDRMGFRLEGPSLERAGTAEVISGATPLGALQVPPAGAPILLMADRQTTGGYPGLAVVITADIGIAAQRGPGDPIRFRVCSRKEAIAALIARERELGAMVH